MASLQTFGIENAELIWILISDDLCKTVRLLCRQQHFTVKSSPSQLAFSYLPQLAKATDRYVSGWCHVLPSISCSMTAGGSKALRKRKRRAASGSRRGQKVLLAAALPPSAKSREQACETPEKPKVAKQRRKRPATASGTSPAVKVHKRALCRPRTGLRRKRLLARDPNNGTKEDGTRRRGAFGRRRKGKVLRASLEHPLTAEPTRPAQDTAPDGAGDGRSNGACEEVEVSEAHPSVARKPVKKRKGAPVKGICSQDLGTSQQSKKEKRADVDVKGKSDTDDASPCLKVCAANLPWWFDKTKIWQHFRSMGEVVHIWQLYNKWGESQGVAFITFSDKASVKAALQCDGTSVEGNVIRVNLALDKNKDAADSNHKGRGKGWAGGGSWAEGPDRQGNGDFGGKAASAKGKAKGKGARPPAGVLALPDRPKGSRGLLARGLSYDVTDDDLKETFSACGAGPTRVRVLVDKSGWSKGKAFMDFADEAAVEEAMKFNDTMLKGRKLRLEYTHASS